MSYTFREAFRLSPEEVKSARPIGTVDLANTWDPGHEGETVLLPVPSNDPADPLNWATWRKLGILFCMFYYAFIGNFAASSIGSALPVLGEQFALPFGKLSYATSVCIIMMGCWNLVGVPLANTFGRRVTVLGHLLILIAADAWAAKASTFSQLLAARVFMGIGISVSETVGPDIVGEVFFIHHQGGAMAFYTLGLSVGALAGGISGSFIASYGMIWIHWTNLIMACAGFTLCFFFQPETMFDRNAAVLRDVPGGDDSDKPGEKRTEFQEITASAPETNFAPYTWKRALAMGVYRPGFVEKFLSIAGTLRFPGLWLVMLWYAGLTSGVIIFGIVGPTLMTSPPYNWGKNSGLISIGGAGGAIVAGIYTAFFTDRAIKNRFKAGHGVYEPESRLPLAFPALILGTLGIWTFGFTAANPGGVRWLGMEFGQAMNTFALTSAPTIGFTYILDSYYALSGDCFVMAAVIRAIISFAWSFFVNDWIASRGIYEPFGIFGGFMGFTGLLTFVIIFYGKRIRLATQKWVPVHNHH